MQLLKVTHGVDDKLTEVGDGVKGIKGEVQVVRKIKVVDDKLEGIITDVKEIKTTAMEARLFQKTADVRRGEAWQSSPDLSTLACDYLHGSAEWFFQDGAFEEWMANGSLWIHRKPECHKVSLPSTLRVMGKLMIDLDFLDIDKQARRKLLSLLIRLSGRSNPRCDILSRLSAAHDNGARHPNDSALMQCLTEMPALPNQDPTFVVLNALDECPSTSRIPSARKQVLDLVKDLRLPDLHICVTSRPHTVMEGSG
ncbi:hypothetical protein EDB87DRAFT_691395 [Lactarius vividus]|nr:hypothetical protein EDB87DRAFT_691395 [Lactarius vividus]